MRRTFLEVPVRPVLGFLATGGTVFLRTYPARPGYWRAGRQGWTGRTIPYAPYVSGPAGLGALAGFTTYPAMPAVYPESS